VPPLDASPRRRYRRRDSSIRSVALDHASVDLTAAGNREAVDSLAAADVRFLVLAGGGGRATEVLVDRADAARARAAMEDLHWFYGIGDLGAWRRLPRRTYVWADGSILRLFWAIAASPLPGRAMRRLERQLWRAGTTGPREADRAVYLALQAVREGMRDSRRVAELRALPPGALAVAEHVAADCGLLGTFRRAVAGEPAAGPLLDSRTGAAFERAARAARRHARPRVVRELLSGEPWGRAAVRCRFAGIEVHVDRGVFLPRPETEGLVRHVLAGCDREDALVVEVASGCAAPAFALAAAKPSWRVHAVEVDPVAHACALENRERLGAKRVSLHLGSLLEPVTAAGLRPVDAVLANLPSVTGETWDVSLARSAEHSYRGEGEDGLGLHRRLAVSARDALAPGGLMVLQVSPAQWRILLPELVELGYTATLAEQMREVAIGAARR
jgi:release factor glutamine methyltransferase